MKLCFSTLGCPSWDLSEILSTAKDFGYDGIEIRGIASEIYAPSIKAFSPSEIDKTNKKMSEMGITIPIFTTGCLLHEIDKDYVKDAMEYIDLCVKTGTKYIRVLADTDPSPKDKIDYNLVAEKLKKIADYGMNKGVMPLVETNGEFASSDNLLKLLDMVGSSNVGVLWDIHHPYRYANEEVADTYNKLKKFIKHVHIKDSVVQNGKTVYTISGEGDIPIGECVALLKNGGYDDFLSLEWVKRWMPELTEPGIVFMNYIDYMKCLI